jgi:hypothetical protein
VEEEQKFYFLELNPRLQVEHPVTEMITNVNLPAAQLQVAMGIPLHRIPDIRALYPADGMPGAVAGSAMLLKQVMPRGHVIAARITAENTDAGFTPTSGAIEELSFRSTPQVWGYFSLDVHGQVHEFADSQIGHLFSFGTDRNAARKHMVMALKELSIRGDIRTTVGRGRVRVWRHPHRGRNPHPRPRPHAYPTLATSVARQKAPRRTPWCALARLLQSEYTVQAIRTHRSRPVSPPAPYAPG